ncbi:hypothetical protein [Actinoplanes sp. NPDC049599]|uniref:hypothetical protein n=1 Tax=Actinoplanes sp. NPDC049599 TaxID=3363903 RepID=UPI0037A72547
MSPLERRYRRLLRVYPPDHRREYEEEMIGVLLAETAPGRRGPGPRDVVDLVLSALAVRWRRRRSGLRDERWVQAARAVQVFGSLLLLAVGLHRFAIEQTALLRYGAEFTPPVPSAELLRPGAWALVLLLALLGRHRLAALAATAGVVAEAVPPLGLYLDTPARLLDVYWMLVAATVVAVASLLTSGKALPVGTGSVAAAAALVVIGGVGSVLLHGSTPQLMLGWRPVPVPAVVCYGAAVVLVVLGVLRSPAPVLRRLVVAAVPIVVCWPLVRVGFGGLIAHNVRAPEPTLLGPVQWAALLVLPLLALWVAATLNRRYEADRVS